jgi:hypothetical protein
VGRPSSQRLPHSLPLSLSSALPLTVLLTLTFCAPRCAGARSGEDASALAQSQPTPSPTGVRPKTEYTAPRGRSSTTTSRAPQPEAPQVYVRNLLVGTAHLVEGRAYICVQAVARAACVPVTVSAQGVVVVRDAPTDLVAVRIQQEWCAPVQALGPRLGFCVRYDRELAVIDLTRPTTVADFSRPINASSPGAAIKLSHHLAPGRETLFFFGTQGDANTARLDPYVNRLGREREGLVVRRVEVNRRDVPGIDWESPLMLELGIRSVPYFVIFDAKATKIAEGDAAYRIMIDWLHPNPGATP